MDAIINTCFIMVENVILLTSIQRLKEQTGKDWEAYRWNNNGSEQNQNPDQFSAYSERELRKQMLKLKIRLLSSPILLLLLYFTAGGGHCDCDADSTADLFWKGDALILIVSIADD